MTTNTRLIGWLAAATIAISLTACNEKSDNEELKPDKPTPQVPTGNKFTIAPTGGTVEAGTLKMEIPSGTFSEEKALYVDNAGNIQELKDVAASNFYKLTLPATTQKPIRISVRSQQASDGCLMVVRSAGRATSGGEQQDFCVPIEKVAYSGDTYTAELPTLEGGDGMAEVTVGLITTESAEAATRTGDTYSDITVMLPYANRSIKVEVTSQTLYYDVAKTRILREKFIPQALHKLDSIGFRLDADRETIPIEIVAYWYKEKREGLWGQHICSKLTKHWDCVQINGEKLVNMTTQEEQDELAKTLIHELGHYFQTDYDKRRSQWSKATESPGAYLALMEASSVWTEHYFGAPLSSIVVDYGKDFLSSGLWNCSESNYDTHGYGMAVLFTYLAKQFGDLSLMSIFNDYKTGKDADVCLTNYAKAHNFRIDDIDWYNDFLRATAEGSVIDKYDMGGLTAKSWGVNDEALLTNTITLNRYGMAVRSLYLLEGANIDGKQINLGEEEKGTYTEVYRADYEFSRVKGVLSTVSNITYLGRISHDTQLTVMDSLTTMFKKQRLFFVTLQDPQQSHQISVPSKLTYQLCDPQPTLSVMDTNASFTADGGEKQITVTSNCSDVSVTEKPAWCSASISGHTLTLRAEKNTTTEKREGNVVVKARNATGEVADTVKVTQEGKAKTNTVTVSYYAAYFMIRLKSLPTEVRTMNLGVTDVFYLTCPYTYTSKQVSDTIWTGGTSNINGTITNFTAVGETAPFPYNTANYWSETWNMNIQVDQEEEVASGSINQQFTRDFYAQDPLKYDVGSVRTVTYTVALNLTNVPYVGNATIGNYDYWTNHDGVNKVANYFLIDGASPDCKEHVSGTVTLYGYSYPTTDEVVIDIKDADIDYIKLYLIPQ